VTAKESGAPLILFHGRARELYEQSGANAAHLSIAHTAEHAIAEVILEKNSNNLPLYLLDPCPSLGKKLQMIFFRNWKNRL
jgi:hypothetical protein